MTALGRNDAKDHSTPDQTQSQNPIRSARRSVLRGFGMAGAALTAGMLPGAGRAQALTRASRPTAGDIAILRFLAFAELVESDLWQQYAELGGLGTQPLNPYQVALSNLDGDAGQYITSNTLDELSHAAFLNAYLAQIGAEPVDLDRFRTLPSSQATGAEQTGRLTNLMQLSVDTSWYVRYRSSSSPDFGASYPQALPHLRAGQFPAIPRSDADFEPAGHIQAIANTAAFHFGSIEQGGTSLYASFSRHVSSGEVLEITLGIGGDEICHFLEWVDFAGNGVQAPVAPLTDPTNGLHFPNFIAEHQPLVQPNLIFPVPAVFIDSNLPLCAVIRPISPTVFTAMGVVQFLAGEGLFIGQSTDFTRFAEKLATAADAARRQI